YNQFIVVYIVVVLRTCVIYLIFREEVKRQLTGVLAVLFFSPTERAKQNLLNENKLDEHIFVTGNTAIDALKTTVKDTYTNPVLDHVGSKRLVLLTAHRRENLVSNMAQIFRSIMLLCETHES